MLVSQTLTGNMMKQLYDSVPFYCLLTVALLARTYVLVSRMVGNVTLTMSLTLIRH